MADIRSSPGLPTSPIVDPNRNLTPEWLHALGDIERITELKKALENSTGNVTSMDDLEGMLAALQERVIEVGSLAPNNAFYSMVPYTVDVATLGVVHGLGTADYLCTDMSDTNTFIIHFSGISIPVRDETKWTISPVPGRSGGSGWVTVSVS